MVSHVCGLHGIARACASPEGNHVGGLQRAQAFSSFSQDTLKDPRTGEISTTKSLACSAVAGGVAHACTYPLHLARTVLQQPVPEGGRAYSGFVDVLRHRVATQGIAGCFRGLPIWLCNRVPAVAIEFSVNERALDAMKWMATRRSERGGVQM